MDENTQTVGTYAATDADSGDTITYSVSGGTDSDLFTVNSETGALTFSSAPNFEAPGCGSGDDSNTCTVILQASDDSNTDTITITVTVVDVNDAPTVSSEISDATIDEDSAYSLDVSCLLYTSPSPRDKRQSRMPSSA